MKRCKQKISSFVTIVWKNVVIFNVTQSTDLLSGSQKTCRIRFASDPDRIGSVGQKRARWFLHTGLLLDWIRLAKTWHSQPDANRMRAGFAHYDPGHLWKTAAESESGKLVAGRLRSARTGPDGSCTPACFQTRFVRPNLGQAIQIGSGPVLYNMIRLSLEERIRIRFRKSDPAYTIRPNSSCTVAVIMAITDRNQNVSEWYPVCLLGLCVIRHGKVTLPSSVRAKRSSWLRCQSVTCSCKLLAVRFWRPVNCTKSLPGQPNSVMDKEMHISKQLLSSYINLFSSQICKIDSTQR